MNLEKKILKHLLYDDEFVRKTIPFIKEDYFQDITEKTVYKQIVDYILKYKSSPTVDALKIEVDSISNLNQEQHKKVVDYVDELAYNDVSEKDTEWLIENSEQFCQEKAVYNAIMESIQILDDDTKALDKGAIPQILADALSVSFDNHVGHDFIADAEERYEFYHRVESSIPFDLDYMNRITKNGIAQQNSEYHSCWHWRW